MRGSRWVRHALLLLLLAAAAASASNPTKRDPENAERWLEVPVRTPEDAGLTIAPAESQQVSVVAASDLHASETGYGKGYGKGSSHKGHKGYKGGYHDEEGYKGKKGYKADKGYKKNHYGDYGKDHKAGYHDKGGKYYKGHDDKHKYYGDEHKGKKGKKGHHYGTKGHHNKGHKDKGFKNVYHKEEYHHQKNYYDDLDNQKYHNKYDDFDSYFDAHKGKDYKGGHYKREITQKTYHTYTQIEPQLEESLIISRVKAALEKINETQKVTRIDVDTKPLRYSGRVLLDTSRYRTRYEDRDDYNDQCQTHDLKLIKKYLKNCNKFMRKYGMREDRTPPCVNDDIIKINKYLSICEKSFTSRASHRKRKQYNELMDLGNKLDMMTYPEVATGENDENHYVTEDVCQVDDLRQMELYLKDCASGKGDEEEPGRPACDLPNFEKSLDYLTACESTFLSRASRSEKKEYNHIISVALTLIKRETTQTERVKYEDSDDSQTSCTVEDLRESQNYIEECESLLLTESYQREYGSQMCRPKYMKKVYKFLLSCKHLLRNAPSKDQKKFSELLDTSARLSGKPGKQKKQIQLEDPIDEHPDCRFQDLRSVPKYLRGCYKSKNCESETLLEVHEFLVMCEDFFFKYASPRDKKKYKDLMLMSDMLNTNEILQKQKRDRDDREHMESICKIQILRKVPKYLKGCFESGNCNSKQLQKVIKFLTLCEEFFSIAFSPKDRGKYKGLKEMTEELQNHAEEQKKSQTKEKTDHTGPDCTLSDLRKIPDYLKGCERTQKCKRRQLLKVYQFLFYCEIPFTRSAPRRDKRKYKKIMLLSEKLSKSRQSKGHKCEVSQLRKIPRYLQKCNKYQNCKPRQLLKVQKYLRLCESAFFSRASKRDKGKYKQMLALAVALTRHRHRRVPRREVYRRRKDRHSQCQIRDLRKIPNYLKTCARKNNCKRKQLEKVKTFLISCTDEFAGRASRKDKIIYEKLYMKAKALTKDHQKRGAYKQKSKDRQSYCQVKDLRKIPSYLKRCTKTRQCKARQLIKVRRFLSTCQNHFSRRASRRDRRIYTNLSSMAEALSKHRFTKRGDTRKRDAKLSNCKLKDLRRVPSYLKNCSKSHRCDRRLLIKVKSFLTSCKTNFFRKASRRDKKMYQRLSSSAEKLNKHRSAKRGDTRKRDAKLSFCKLRDLRKIPSYLKNCSKSHRCDRRQLLKVNRFLTSCKTIFFRKSSRRDEKIYKRLSSSAEALSQHRSAKRGDIRKRDARVSYCKLRDLRRVPSYLKNCSKSHRCDRRQLIKVKSFLTSCKTNFLRKASRRDKQIYQRLSSSAEKLSQHRSAKRSHTKKRDAKQIYCKLRDLRKVPSYLKNCSKSHRCDRRQLLKVNRFLTSCKTNFFRKASRRDKKIYQRLSSSAEALSKHRFTKRGDTGKKDAKLSYCKLKDLRKVPSYLKNCSKSHRCDRRQLLKVNRFLTSCKTNFFRKSSRRDKKIYKSLSSSAEALSKHRLAKRGDIRKKDTKLSYCKLSDLRKIPGYLKTCSKSHRCDRKQLLKVNRFLTSCKTIFLRKASRRDKKMYQRLSSSAEKLSKHRFTKRSHTRKRDTKLSYCKLRDLRKVPSYLKNCSKSHRCDRRQLIKVKSFLTSCKTIFFRKSSRRDKKIYLRLSSSAEKLSKHRFTKRGDTRKRDAKLSYCKLKDLRKVPSYLKNCSKSHRCDRRQLLKVKSFLTSCQTNFFRKASRRDKKMYQRLSSSAEALSKYRFTKRSQTRKRDAKLSYCKLRDLRKVPSYLKNCSKSRKCDRRQLLKVKNFLTSCKSSFTGKASRKDIRIYQRLSVTTESLIKHRPRRTLSKDKYISSKRKATQSRCQIRDLRKVPSYLKSCSKAHDCKQSQLVKVERFLLSCQTHFMRRTSKKDSRVYKGLISLSKKLVFKDQDKRKEGRSKRRKITPGKHAICQVKNLRLIQKHLGTCQQRAKQVRGSPKEICKSKAITKMQKYLLSCQKIFLRKGTRRDKGKYKSLLILSEKLMKTRITKSRKRDVRRRDIKRSICQVRDLRKIPKYLKDCSTGVITTGRKKVTCGKRMLGKIRTFLSSCKTEFSKKASRRDKIEYRNLEVQAARIQSRKAKGKDFRRGRKPATHKISRCKIQDLRQVKSYLKDCSSVVRKGARLRRDRRCNTLIIARVQKYLRSCQSTFLRKASREDKKQYKSLFVLSNRLSKQISMSRKKVPPKKTEKYSCRKQDLRELEKHYKFCKAKLRSGSGRKSQLRRRRGSSRAHKMRRQQNLKRTRSRLQHRKYRSHPRKRSKRTARIEHGRRRGRRWRSKLKYRKGGKHHDKYGKKGHHEKGKYHDDHKGHKGHYAHKGHYGHKSAYGDNGGYKGGYGHHDHGHHYGGHGHGYGRLYLDPYLPKYCYSERFCVPYTPPYMYPVPFLIL